MFEYEDALQNRIDLLETRLTDFIALLQEQDTQVYESVSEGRKVNIKELEQLLKDKAYDY